MRKVVVITGASSGMGREAALKLARRGDEVVLAARDKSALDAVARECEGRALVVPTDVSDPDAVAELRQQAVAAHGRIDAWAHTAAVGAFGRVWELPPRTVRQLVETDLTAAVYVAQQAVQQFLAQPDGGTLVLVSSTLGRTPLPYLSVYSAAKHGVVGLAASLRADLKDAGHENVRVVDLQPPSTDTPFYAKSANYVGRLAKAPPPAYRPETLGGAIVDALDDPSNEEVTVGAVGKLMRAAHGVAPGLYERVTGPYSETMFTEARVPVGDGDLFAPRGGQRGSAKTRET